MFYILACLGCGGQSSSIREEPALGEDLVYVARPALQMYLVLTADKSAMQDKADVADMWTAVHAERDDFSFVSTYLKRIQVPRDYRIDIELDFAQLPHRLLPWNRLEPMLKRLEPSASSRARSAQVAVSFRSRNSTLPKHNHLRLIGAAVLRTAERYDGIVLDLLTRRAYTPSDFRELLTGDADQLGKSVITLRRLPNKSFVLMSRGQLKIGLPDFVIGPFNERDKKRQAKLIEKVKSDLANERASFGRRIRYLGNTWTYKACPDWGHDGQCRYLTSRIGLSEGVLDRSD